eukprot:gene47778-41179_t
MVVTMTMLRKAVMALTHPREVMSQKGVSGAQAVGD